MELHSSAILLFLTGLMFSVYVMLGYPAALLVWSHLRRNPVRKRSITPSISVLLSVRNGEAWIRDKLDCLLTLDYPADRIEIIVISDGSTDRTEEIVRSFDAKRVRLLSVAAGGKAQALNAGMREANGEILFFTDVRQYLTPDSIREMMASFADETVGAVTGELHIRSSERPEGASVGLYWRYEKAIRKSLSRIDSTLGATGCIYAVRRSLAVEFPKGLLLDDVYLPMIVLLSGFRVVFEEKAKAYDDPTTLSAEFRRKLRTLAGVYQLVGYLPRLLGPKNRMAFHFWSHKIGRLLLPYALLVMIGSSFYMPSPFRNILITGQLTALGCVALDSLLPCRSTFRRLTSPIRAFSTLMLASLCAGPALLVGGSSRLWANPTAPDRKGKTPPRPAQREEQFGSEIAFRPGEAEQTRAAESSLP